LLKVKPIPNSIFPLQIPAASSDPRQEKNDWEAPPIFTFDEPVDAQDLPKTGTELSLGTDKESQGDLSVIIE
jgi:hypothetical protein